MENFDEIDFEELKQQVNDNKNGIITGNIKNVNYEINLSKPIRVVLKDEKNEIEFYSGKLASSKIQIDRIENRAHYRKKNSLNLGVTLIRVVNVIESEINNKHYISEKYLIREQFDENMIAKKSDKIIEELLANDNTIKATNEGEFVKEPILSNDELDKVVKPEEELNQYLIEGSKTKLGNFPSGFYEDRHDFEFNKKNKKQEIYENYIELSKKELDKYNDLYAKILDSIDDKQENIEEKIADENNQEEVIPEKSVEEESVIESSDIKQDENAETLETDSDEDLFDEQIDEVVKELKRRNREEREQRKEQENEQTKEAEEEVKINEKDKEDIDDFEFIIDDAIQELKKKKREREMAELRNNKINKIKELINLNKQLDEELEEIENNKNGDGVSNE